MELHNFSNLIQVVAGGILAIFGGAIGGLYKSYRHRRALRLAIAAEINSIVSLVEIRKHEQLFESVVEQWSNNIEINPVINGVDRLHSYASVYKSNLNIIGDIGDDVVDGVVRFYSVYSGIVDDIVSISRGETKAWGVESQIRLVREDLALWREAKERAKSLVRQLVKRRNCLF